MNDTTITLSIGAIACLYMSLKWWKEQAYESGWDRALTVAGALGYSITFIKLMSWTIWGLPQ